MLCESGPKGLISVRDRWVGLGLSRRRACLRMQRWVNLGESLLAVPRPATADVSQMAHPAIQILPPAKTESKSADALVSIFVWDQSKRRAALRAARVRMGPRFCTMARPAQPSHYTPAGESKLAHLRVISFIFRASATCRG
jgi:hypothetical protein